MQKVALLFVISTPFLIVLSGLNGCTPRSYLMTNNNLSVVKNDREKAILEAQRIFTEQKTAGIDMSRGPCLSNEVIPDWVADVAHWPRQAIDNDPANQCPAYREGKAHHFVELDPEGNFIRAY